MRTLMTIVDSYRSNFDRLRYFLEKYDVKFWAMVIWFLVLLNTVVVLAFLLLHDIFIWQ